MDQPEKYPNHNKRRRLAVFGLVADLLLGTCAVAMARPQNERVDIRALVPSGVDAGDRALGDSSRTVIDDTGNGTITLAESASGESPLGSVIKLQNLTCKNDRVRFRASVGVTGILRRNYRVTGYVPRPDSMDVIPLFKNPSSGVAVPRNGAVLGNTVSIPAPIPGSEAVIDMTPIGQPLGGIPGLRRFVIPLGNACATPTAQIFSNH